METKLYLTLLILFLSLQICEAQQIIYGDKSAVSPELKESSATQSDSEKKVNYYKVDQMLPNAFTTGNKTMVICRLVPDGADSNVVCSTHMPDNGWGTMVSEESGSSYKYEEKNYNNGANVYSIAFTDPMNGWAVGVMENHSTPSGVVFHTKDGGQSWNIQFRSGTGMNLSTVGFTDAKNGWVNGIRSVGHNSYDITLVTVDGGETWTEQNLAQLSESNN